MSAWNPESYLQFQKQRTQPAIDLANRIRECNPKTVADIGCGPGNSTAILKSVFPHAEICGIDNSETMLSKARAARSDISFQFGSADNLTGHYDLLFSNACLQWLPAHETLIPKLMSNLNENGTLAVQIPMSQQEPLFRIIRAVAAESEWDFSEVHFVQNEGLTPDRYHEILSSCAAGFDMWETVYYHIMPSHLSLIEWVRSTRLRPYLDVLNPTEQAEFENRILQKVQKAYPATKRGEVIFKFNRFFFTARK